MTAVVGEACRVYWGYQVWELPEGTVVPEGEFADHLVAIGAATREADPPAEPKRRPRRTDS